MSAPVLVTGAAGFIGYHVATRLLEAGRIVVGIDSFSDYYDPALKAARFAHLLARPGFTGERADLSEPGVAARLMSQHGIREVVHLAAQPGIRRALTHAEDYIAANLTAFVHLLEACRHAAIGHLVYASSSSVYGQNSKLPFGEADAVDHPISLYAATKRANELMAHAYSHLFGLPTTGLRFFTVYGPWGRPDMAVYRFTDAIANGRAIEVADGGRVRRDFTYVDDVADGVVRVLASRPRAGSGRADSPAASDAPFRIYNIGGDRPAALNDVILLIERALGRKAERRDVPLPPGDMHETRADTRALEDFLRDLPPTPLALGIERFVAWYLGYRDGRVALDSASLQE